MLLGSKHTLISLITVEVGINVEGGQSCKINKRGGWDFLEKTRGWIFFFKISKLDFTFIREMRAVGHIDECCSSFQVEPPNQFQCVSLLLKHR